MNESDLDKQAEGFESREETTSPEVYRGNARFQHEIYAGQNPVAIVGSRSTATRKDLILLLEVDGWDVQAAKSAEELIDLTRVRRPHIVIVDHTLIDLSKDPIPEIVRRHQDLAAVRLIAMLNSDATEEIAGVIADGYDDFISANSNPVEVLARAASNLRACRSMSLLDRKQRDAASLLELSQALASSLDLQLILHSVSRLIAEVIDAERCSIVVIDPENKEAVMVAASEDRSVRDLRIQLDDYPELQRCVSSSEPVLISDTRANPILTDVRERVEAKRVGSMALFPIVFEERVMGVLFLRSTKTNIKYTDHEVQFGQTVASACAVAIRNARLFDSFRDQHERINYMRIMAERQMEALKKYEESFEYAADGMAIVDVEGTILYVNREGRRLLGKAESDLREKSFLHYVAAESQKRWPDIVDQVRHGRFREAFDFYMRDDEGNERIFWLSAGGVGQDTGLLVLSYRDVTETREMEVELRTTKEFLENLIDNSVDAIVAADMSGNLMLFNKGAEQLYKYDAKEVIGRLHVSDLYPQNLARDMMRQLRDPRWGGRGRLQAQRREILDAHGNVVPVSMTASIIYEDGEEVATVGVLTDLRERIKIEKRLSEAQDELMINEKARVAAQLAGMAAHELNQPLTSVLGYAEMLRHRIDEDDTRRRKPVDVIFTQAERMAKIVRKIGRITKYETKHYGGGSEIINLEAASEPDQTQRPDLKQTMRLKATSVADIVRPDSIDEVKIRKPIAYNDEPDVTGKMRPAPRGPVLRVDEKETTDKNRVAPSTEATGTGPAARRKERPKTGETERFKVDNPKLGK